MEGGERITELRDTIRDVREGLLDDATVEAVHRIKPYRTKQEIREAVRLTRKAREEEREQMLRGNAEQKEAYRQGYEDGFWACANILGPEREYGQTELGRMAKSMIAQVLRYRLPVAVREWAARMAKEEESDE